MSNDICIPHKGDVRASTVGKAARGGGARRLRRLARPDLAAIEAAGRAAGSPVAHRCVRRVLQVAEMEVSRTRTSRRTGPVNPAASTRPCCR